MHLSTGCLATHDHNRTAHVTFISVRSAGSFLETPHRMADVEGRCPGSHRSAFARFFIFVRLSFGAVGQSSDSLTAPTRGACGRAKKMRCVSVQHEHSCPWSTVTCSAAVIPRRAPPEAQNK